MADYNMKEEGGLIDRIKESPRTVSALIIILIVAAAIYAFSGEEDKSTGETSEQAATTETEENAGLEKENNEADTLEEGTVEGALATKEPKVAAGAVTDGTTTEINKQSDRIDKPTVVEPYRTETGFVEVAEAGNGITHLARKASARWLSENQAGYAVTDEHRIFVEDYIQNKLGTSGLTMGQSMEISFSLIQEAVAAAGELDEGQLNNLGQYTYVLK